MADRTLIPETDENAPMLDRLGQALTEVDALTRQRDGLLEEIAQLRATIAQMTQPFPATVPAEVAHAFSESAKAKAAAEIGNEHEPFTWKDGDISPAPKLLEYETGDGVPARTYDARANGD